MIRFLHAADLHLDSPLRGLERYEGAPADRIRGATRKALENLVTLALDERVDFVLLAGDLYDGDWPDYNTGLFLTRQMSRLQDAGIPTFVIRGNHDADNRMTRSLRLPDKVRLLATDRPESVRLDHLGVTIHGQGFATAAVTDDLSAAYPVADRGQFNIGLLHTCADGLEGHDRYAPCTPAALARKNYDYWALGHIHKRQSLHEAGGAPIEFPGNTQGRHARETGAKGCLLVTVDHARRATTEFRRLDVVRWEDCQVAAAEATTEDDLADRVASRLTELTAAEDPDRLLAARVTLTGPSPIHDRLAADPSRCAAAVRARVLERDGDRLWIETVKVRTRPVQARDASALDGPGAELMAVLADARAESARAGLLEHLSDLRRKLPTELIGPDGIDLDDPDWLAAVLDEAEAILRDKLLSQIEAG